ncbi:adenosine deaminase [bacterium]|nr:adenosine deaminase [bacterium]
MNNFTQQLQQLPKVELHVHLDCSLSFQVVQKILPGTTQKDYNERFVAPENCGSLVEYIKCASASIDIMQTREQLELVTLDFIEQLQADNVIYCEVRFAPLQHLNQGLTAKEVVKTVNEAISKATADLEMEVRLILCSLRHFSEAQSLETVQLVHDFKGTNVVGFDLAADEAGYPVDEHKSAFEFARENEIPCTCHAGEACGPKNVWEAIDELHVQRIGHGVRSYEDSTLMEYLKEKDIHLEVCPTSNIKTGIYPKLANHNIDKIYRSGVSLSVNTDGRSLSNVSLFDEYKNLNTHFDWKLKDYLATNLFAIEAAFVDEETKTRLKKKLLDQY